MNEHNEHSQDKSENGEHHEGHQMNSGGNGSHSGHNGGGGHAAMLADFRRRFIVSLALTLPVLALAPLIQDFLGVEERLDFKGDGVVQFAFATPIYFYGGWPFIKGLFDEVRRRNPGMMTLIGMAISVAYFYSTAVVFTLPGEVFFWELATLIDVMLLGHWIEMRSVMGASGALEKLVEMMPSEAHRISDGETEDVPVTELAKGDVVLVKPGEKIPIDGVVRDGRTTVNEAMLTGESRPVEKGEGDEVIGGAINGESAIEVEVQKSGEETYLSQVIDMVRKAQESRSKTQDLANRAARFLTFSAIAIGSVTLAVWLALGEDFNFALARAVTVMVIACPHALGLAVPLVVAVSTSLSAQNGLLIRDRTAFERARELDAVIFDKTGTLTEGRFGVTDVISVSGWEEEKVLAYAAALEERSEHPIAAGIAEEAKKRGHERPKVADFSAIPGKGVEAQINGTQVRVVSPGYLRENNISLNGAGERLESVASEGKTVVYVIADGQVEGAIALADIVREESRDALDQLKEMGVKVMMLTGDAEAVAREVATELDLDDYFAEVLPDKKAEKVREVKARGLQVAMVGDGVNDAPALVEADVGVAIGAGTDVAVESADIVLVRSDPRDVTAIVQLAKATYSKMVQNLWWAAGYNIVAIPLAAGVAYSAGFLMPPAAGAALMSVSTVVVALNARLLGRISGKLAGREGGEASA